MKREALTHAPGSRAVEEVRKMREKEALVCVKTESLEVRTKLSRRLKGAKSQGESSQCTPHRESEKMGWGRG